MWEAKDVPVPERYLKDPNGTPAPDMNPFTFFEDDRVKVSAKRGPLRYKQVSVSPPCPPSAWPRGERSRGLHGRPC